MKCYTLGQEIGKHPKDTTFVNKLYAVKDRNVSLIESDLADITNYSVLSGEETKLQPEWLVY